MREATGKELEINLTVRRRPRLQPAAAAAQRPKPAYTDLNPKYTFDSFVIGSSNRFAHAAALAVAEAPAQAYNPLFIYGGTGLGKTHLLQAISQYIAEHSGGLTVHYVTSETFMNAFINSLRDKRIEGFKQRYRNYDLLLIDDIQFFEHKESIQEEFFHTFNSLYEAGRQIIISSDRPPRSFPTLEERLRSRFEWGLITDIQPPDLETRIAILRKKVKTDGTHIPDPQILTFIASRISSNIRELEGALTRVVAFSSLTGRPITVELAQDVLQDVFPQGDSGQVSIDRIQDLVSQRFSLTRKQLCGDRRSQNIVYPRQVAMYLSRELTDASLPEDRPGVRRARPHDGHPRDLQDRSTDQGGPVCVQPRAGVDCANQASPLKTSRASSACSTRGQAAVVLPRQNRLNGDAERQVPRRPHALLLELRGLNK